MLTVYVTVSSVLCGLLVPVHWFPGWLAAVAASTPFPSMLAGARRRPHRAGERAGLPALLATQLAWLVAMLAAGQVVQRLGTGVWWCRWLTPRLPAPDAGASTGPCSARGCARSSCTGRRSGSTCSAA